MVLALTVDGRLTPCTAPPDKRGQRNCNHVHHQENETMEHFIQRIEQYVVKYEEQEVSPEEESLNELDKITGEKLTLNNWEEVLSKMPPEKVYEVMKIGFKHAPILPIKKIDTKRIALDQMFVRIGSVPVHNGTAEIEGNYENGLSDDEYFLKTWSSRAGQVRKTVDVAAPGYAVYINQEVTVLRDKKQIDIAWKQIKLWDVMQDGSKVIYIDSPTYKDCYEVRLEKPMILSHEHMIYSTISFKTHPIHCQKSMRLRKKLKIKNDNWHCISDLYQAMLYGLDVEVNGKEVSISPVGKKECFCISTDTGEWLMFGIRHHNTARKLFYGLSDIIVSEKCSSNGDSLTCLSEGICCECAARDGQKLKPGEMIGAKVSTNLSEPLTQLEMREVRSGGRDVNLAQERAIIRNTYDAFSNSPIIQEALKGKTTLERRVALYKGLKNEYKKHDIEMDDFNLKIIARKMTSYRKKEYVKEGEVADIVSILSIANMSNPFKRAQLKKGYNILTTPGSFSIKKDAVNEIIF